MKVVIAFPNLKRLTNKNEIVWEAVGAVLKRTGNYIQVPVLHQCIS